MHRFATATLVVAAAAALAACAGGSGARFPEDERRSGNLYYEEPQVLREQLLRDPWAREIELSGGATFGTEVPRIVRVAVSGAGPMLERDLHLHTPASVQLFSGSGGERMKRLVHGMLQVLDERDGLVAGLSFAGSRASFEAAALSPWIEENVVQGELTAADRRLVQRVLGEIAREEAAHAYAWYYPRTSWMTVGPELTRTIRQHVDRPSTVAPADGIFTAFVIRHEIEHAVTAAETDGNERFDWIEEGGAEVLAMWPGEAARTAEAMGLPYPKRFERLRYDPGRGGYPAWERTLVLLLRAAGVDHAQPRAWRQASRLLQTGEPHDVPGALAAAIASEQGLPRARQAQLERQIAGLDGDPDAARRVVAGWL